MPKIIKGTNHKDRLIGTRTADQILGLRGNDILIGGRGSDILNGGPGGDIMRGGPGNDVYFVDSIKDVVDEQNNNDPRDKIMSIFSIDLSKRPAFEDATLLGKGNLIAFGSDKNNILTGNAGFNTLVGRDGNDTLNGGSGDDLLMGGVGNDSLNGGAGNDNLFGGVGNNVFNGGTGADMMVGTLGDDFYFVDNPGDIIFDTGGVDTVASSISADLSIGAFGQGNIENLTLIGTGHINGRGTIRDNSIIGNTGNNIIAGGGGTDTISGNDGNDTLDGESGSDILFGGRGNDTIIDSLGGNDQLAGEDGNDTLRGGAGSDSVVGGKGIDKITLDSSVVDSDQYFYTLADLGKGEIDEYFGVMDTGTNPFFDAGDDIIVLLDLITLTANPNTDEIRDFISQRPDGNVGCFYLYDRDGGGTRFNPVPFIHFINSAQAGGVGFMVGTIYEEIRS